MLLKKIVVAEDDDAIAHMVSMALGDAGFLCLRAKDGEEALNLVRMHAPDLLVLDVMMPRLDGIEVARKLKADVIWSKTPILMLTALSSVDNKIEGFDAGADDYVVKPFDLREFAARCRALIRTARRERERNPTTDLPGSVAVEQQIEEVIAGGVEQAILHFDLRDFDRYADQIGYARAEELVGALGRLILEKTRIHGGGSAFVGHMGGVDFIALTQLACAEDLARDVIDAYEARKASWLEAGSTEAVPMAIAVSTTAGLDGDPVAASKVLSSRMATAMREAKQRDGSSYVVWQPETA